MQASASRGAQRLENTRKQGSAGANRSVNGYRWVSQPNLPTAPSITMTVPPTTMTPGPVGMLAAMAVAPPVGMVLTALVSKKIPDGLQIILLSPRVS